MPIEKSGEHCEKRSEITISRKTRQSSIRIDSSAFGHPVIRHNIILYAGIKNIYFETSVFKDPAPLLNAHISFPLKAENPRFSYESNLSIIDPVKDYLPGAYSDLISVQNWVRIQDGAYYILWNSLDAPTAGLCRLWPGYVSPAHRYIIDESCRHDPQTEEDYRQNGWIFSQLFYNNFGTNFAVSQTGLAVFRYCLTSGEGILSDDGAVRWGLQTAMPQAVSFTGKINENGRFLPRGQFISSDNPQVAVLNIKAAEDGAGYIARLWNASDMEQAVELRFPRLAISAASLANMTEFGLRGGSLEINKGAVGLKVGARQIMNVRLCFGGKWGN